MTKRDIYQAVIWAVVAFLAVYTFDWYKVYTHWWNYVESVVQFLLVPISAYFIMEAVE